MTKLSVNINKIATLRNSRGSDYPNVCDFAKDIQAFGAAGITVHPRPDERHIKYSDVYDLKEVIYTEFNIEGNPIDKFIKLVTDIKPTQVTLVPDEIDAITSNAGWDTNNNKEMLKEIVDEFRFHGIRTSIFLDPEVKFINSLCQINPDRVELYTYSYAKNFISNNQEAIKPYKEVANFIQKNFPNIKINAGHDLNLENLDFFLKEISIIKEVSIGHALVCDAFIFGLEKTIEKYKYITSSN